MRKTLTAAGLALALAVAGCATQPDNATRTAYPREARDNFVKQCTNAAVKAGGGDRAAAQKTCTCVIGKLEAKLPYSKGTTTSDPAKADDFRDVDAVIRAGKPLPTKLKDIVDKATADCRPK
jgi:hypothetical protein